MDKKTLTKKIIITVLLGLLVGVFIYCIISRFENIKYILDSLNASIQIGNNTKVINELNQILSLHYLCFIAFIIQVLLNTFIIVYLWIPKNTNKVLEYTYKDFKADKEKKRQEKKSKAINKLQKKIDKLK